MAAEQSAGVVAAADGAASEPPPAPMPGLAADAAGQRSLPTPFLTKTFQLVEDPAVDDVISWGDDGSTFVVWRPAEFTRDLLPKYLEQPDFTRMLREVQRNLGSLNNYLSDPRCCARCGGFVAGSVSIGGFVPAELESVMACLHW